MSKFSPPYAKPGDGPISLFSRFMKARTNVIELAREKNYRMKLGSFRFPGLNVFVANDPALVRRVMVEEAADFAKADILQKTADPIIGNAMFVANGAEWSRQRAMIEPAFDHKSVKELFSVMCDATDAMVERLDLVADGRSIDAEVEMSHVTADVICRTIFSVPFGRSDLIEMFEAFSRYQKASLPYGLLMGLGLLNIFAPTRWKLHKASADVRRLVEPLVRPRYDAFQRGEEDDYHDILAALFKARDKKTGESFDFDELVRQVIMLFIAGHETTASSISWALYCLANSPDIKVRAYDEIHAATGEGPIEFDHLKSFKLTRNIFREALRLYPAVGFLFRQSAKHTKMLNKNLCPGEYVVVAPWLIHRHREIWERPDEFDPDRYDTDSARRSLKQGYIPFNTGPRMCIGAGFSMQEGALVIAKLVQHFHIEPDADRTPNPVSRASIRSSNGIWIKLTKRDV